VIIVSEKAVGQPKREATGGTPEYPANKKKKKENGKEGVRKPLPKRID